MSQPLRLALLGAFAFPAPQGSQAFAREQALALRDAGARPCFLCYGRGEGAPPRDVPLLRIAPALSPRSWRSGPHPRKPLADAALALRLLRETRRRGFQAVLAHNAEAAGVALAARALGGPPVVYVAHTLMEEELSAYAPARLRRACDRLGGAIDRSLARRADAHVALGAEAARRIAAHARGPLELVPPGVATSAPPEPAEVVRACARHGLRPGGFALYAGNLDAYQEIALLGEVAARLPDVVVAVATHADPAHAARAPRTLRVLRVAPDEVRPLTHGAAVAIAPRARRGGFPIKLLNYMEASRAIVAREGQAETLRHDESAWLVPAHADAAAFADAIAALCADPARAAALGRAARGVAEREHHWPALAARTLALVRRVACA